MSKKLFVGGLSWDTTNEGLHGAFSRFGEIAEATVINDRDTGRSRGFGFVTFVNDESAASAISEMNGAELDGRTIKVNEAEDRGFAGGGGGGGRGRGGPRGGGGVVAATRVAAARRRSWRLRPRLITRRSPFFRFPICRRCG